MTDSPPSAQGGMSLLETAKWATGKDPERQRGGEYYQPLRVNLSGGRGYSLPGHWQPDAQESLSKEYIAEATSKIIDARKSGTLELWCVVNPFEPPRYIPPDTPLTEANFDWGAEKVLFDGRSYEPIFKVVTVAPQTLVEAADLEQAPAKRQTQQPSPRGRSRGPKAAVGPRVAEAMRDDLRRKRITARALHEMKQSALAANYGASESLCREVRNDVLSEAEFSGDPEAPISAK